MTFRSYKDRIDRASSTKDALAELSDIARQVEADRKLTGRDKLVLSTAVAEATRSLPKIGGAG